MERIGSTLAEGAGLRGTTSGAAEAVAPAVTLSHRLVESARKHASRPALRWKDGEAWSELSYKDLFETARQVAAGLSAEGIGRGDRVAFWLDNCWQWIAADVANQLLGAVTVPIYHTLPPNQATVILNDSGAKALLTSADRLAGLADWEAEEGADGEAAATVRIVVGESDGDTTFEDLCAEGRALLEADEALAAQLDDPPTTPDDLSAIIYTSGTTGVPKGAMLPHSAVLSNMDGLLDCFDIETAHTTLLHLPLAHVVARNSVVSGLLSSGGLVALAEPEREKLPANLAEVKPTLFVTIPYLLDKVKARILQSLTQKPLVARALAKAAFSLGQRVRSTPVRVGGPVRPPREGVLLRVLDKLVLEKIRERLGGNLRFVVIGAANSNKETLEFFWGVGIPVYEAYGMTEVTNCASYTHPGDMKIGTVGHACPRMEYKLSDDGEVLIRGANLMTGYWGREADTAEAIDGDGWYHSGDVGEVDEQGYLRIIDRKKEIMVLATGKNVAPQAVENALKQSPAVLNVCAVGDKRNYVAALVVPDLEVVRERLGDPSPPSIDDRRVRDLFAGEARRAMTGLAGFERAKALILLDKDFSEADRTLTPTLKLRRKEIDRLYVDDLDALYEVGHPRRIDL
jgi:long-chain acyl-CoA synthetase